MSAHDETLGGEKGPLTDGGWSSRVIRFPGMVRDDLPVLNLDAICRDPYCRICKDQDGEVRDDYGCDGSRSCPAHLHVHGCYGDHGTCDAPQEHQERHERERREADLNGTMDRGDLGDGEERPFTQRALVLWAVAWRPASGGSWDILHDDGVPVVFEDKRFAERRSQVWAEKFPDHLYQPLPMEGRP